jgi:membrane protease YdiL (CAAX protease family)
MEQNRGLETRRIYVYLAFAFGLAWVISLVIYLTGGLTQSPMIVPGAGISLAFVLLAGPVMWSPALAHILTRVITREGWHNTYLRPRLRQGWPYWLAAWFLPGILVIAGMVIFFLVFPQYYDSSLSRLRELVAARVPAGTTLTEANLWLIIALQIMQAMLISPVINGAATFGEEFGWRAYLQPKLMPLGGRRATVLVGIIWGVWHAPVILMGYNFGLDYPGAPFLGPLAMVWFTILVSMFLAWVTLKGGSVWPAVIGHAALNGMGSLSTLFTRGSPNLLLGPVPVGLIGSAGFLVVALLIFLSRRALNQRVETLATA